MSFHRRVIRAQHNILGIFKRNLDLGIGHILGNIHQHGTWAASTRNVESLFDRCRHLAHILHQEVVLHARTGDADVIHFLESIVADHVGRHLASEHHHRNGVHVRRSNPGHGIGRARPGRDQHDTDLAGGTRIPIRHVSCALLMAHQHMLHLVLLKDRIVNMQHRPAGVTENDIDTFFLQAADKNLSTGQQFHERKLPQKELTTQNHAAQLMPKPMPRHLIKRKEAVFYASIMELPAFRHREAEKPYQIKGSL